MKRFQLTIIALVLYFKMTSYNRKLVRKRYGNDDGYDRRTGLALDCFANRDLGAMLNEALITENSRAKFGNIEESISEVLGKNQIDGTLTTKPHPDFPRWFYGKKMVAILGYVFNDINHCIDAINLNHSDWTYPEKSEGILKNWK